MLRPIVVSLVLSAFFLAEFLSAPAGAAPWFSLSARTEISNQPRLDFSTPLSAMGLADTQLSGRLPYLKMRIGEDVAPQVSVEFSGSLRQDLDQPLSNSELYQTYESRLAWSRSGGVGLNPLYYAQVEDADIIVRDPVRHGLLKFGQFLLPFGNQNYAGMSLPMAIAPAETPMTDLLSTLGPGAYQASTMARWRDIGGMISGGQDGAFPYAVGIFNGSGPNRLDDNGDKDLFARFDWRSSKTDGIGISALYGQDQVFPTGFGNSGVSVGRRRYGIHWHFELSNVKFQGEWAQDQRLGLDLHPRDGYVMQATQILGGGDLFYVTYSQCFDPNAQPTFGYLVREMAMGDVHPLVPGVSWRVEGLYRWEFAGPHQDNYARFLTALDVQLGGPPAAKPTPPVPPTVSPP